MRVTPGFCFSSGGSSVDRMIAVGLDLERQGTRSTDPWNGNRSDRMQENVSDIANRKSGRQIDCQNDRLPDFAG